jgi:predicted Zn-dependent peptidase
VQKFGDRHAIVYRLDIVHEKFLPHAEKLLDRAVALFAEVLHQPLTEGGGFRPDFVAQEKTNQVRAIQALLDDKISFARLRLIEEMFRGEPFAQYELGSIAEIEALDATGLYRQFESERANRAWDIYFVGDLPPENAADLVRSLVAARPPRPAVLARPRLRAPRARGATHHGGAGHLAEQAGHGLSRGHDGRRRARLLRARALQRHPGRRLALPSSSSRCARRTVSRTMPPARSIV